MMRPTVHLMSLQLYIWWFVALGYMGSAGFSVINENRDWLNVNTAKEMIVFINYSEHGGMWPEQHPNKGWIRFIRAPAQCKRFLKKSICQCIRNVCHQKHGRHRSCDSDQPVEVMMSVFCHAWRLTTLFYSPAAQLSAVPVISQPFFFFSFFPWNSAADEEGMPMLFTGW